MKRLNPESSKPPLPARSDSEATQRDPTLRFGTPEAVLADSNLTIARKIEILRQWEYDQREIGVAVEEGMPGPEPQWLGRIEQALIALTGGLDLEQGPPTKQGGSME